MRSEEKNSPEDAAAQWEGKTKEKAAADERTTLSRKETPPRSQSFHCFVLENWTEATASMRATEKPAPD
jgi:hypothetical protein